MTPGLLQNKASCLNQDIIHSAVDLSRSVCEGVRNLNAMHFQQFIRPIQSFKRWQPKQDWKTHLGSALEQSVLDDHGVAALRKAVTQRVDLGHVNLVQGGREDELRVQETQSASLSQVSLKEKEKTGM
jgi:hypothetical protein